MSRNPKLNEGRKSIVHHRNGEFRCKTREEQDKKEIAIGNFRTKNRNKRRMLIDLAVKNNKQLLLQKTTKNGTKKDRIAL